MREIIFWGGTGAAKVLHEAIFNTDLSLSAIVDNRKLEVSPIPGVPLLHGEPGLDAWLHQKHPPDTLYYAVTIGGGHGGDRLKVMDLLYKRGLRPVSVIHRTAFVARHALIGEGAQILAQSAVCANARLGRGVVINTAASVDHDGVIGDGVHIGPGARLAGEVVIEKRVFVGTGAIVLPRVRIGKDAIVGAGAVVVKDVPAGATVVGNPARILSRTKRGNRE